MWALFRVPKCMALFKYFLSRKILHAFCKSFPLKDDWWHLYGWYIGSEYEEKQLYSISPYMHGW